MIVKAVIAADDLSEPASLHAACFEQAWTEEALRDLLKTPGTLAFAAPDGFVVMRVAGDEAEILTVAVAPGARRKGVGSALLCEAARHAGELGAGTMFLEVSESNAAAMALYVGLGFLEVGRRRSYYGPADDALILRGDLPLLPFGKFRSFD